MRSWRVYDVSVLQVDTCLNYACRLILNIRGIKASSRDIAPLEWGRVVLDSSSQKLLSTEELVSYNALKCSEAPSSPNG
jgi:hypothetical protein